MTAQSELDLGAMDDIYRLAAASEQDGRSVFDMLTDIGPGENGFGNSAYGVPFAAFPDYLSKLEREAAGLDPAEGRVPQTVYWLLRGDYPVGLIKLRHHLNDALRQMGGHIGYSVRPSERGKGLGTVMLRLVLAKAQDLGLTQVLLTCLEHNVPSRRMIEKNGGVLEKLEAGTCFYWIPLPTTQPSRPVTEDSK